jgi:hypothetical protein
MAEVFVQRTVPTVASIEEAGSGSKAPAINGAATSSIAADRDAALPSAGNTRPSDSVPAARAPVNVDGTAPVFFRAMEAPRSLDTFVPPPPSSPTGTSSSRVPETTVTNEGARFLPGIGPTLNINHDTTMARDHGPAPVIAGSEGKMITSPALSQAEVTSAPAAENPVTAGNKDVGLGAKNKPRNRG